MAQPPVPAKVSLEDRTAAVPVPDSQVLPSGRSVRLCVSGRDEEIEIRSPGGEMELRITLTDRGPVLSLRGARLEIDSTDTVAVNCRQFELRTTEGMVLDAAGDVALRSGAEMHLRSAGETFIDGAMLKLNCLDRRGYPDYTGEATGQLEAPLGGQVMPSEGQASSTGTV